MSFKTTAKKVGFQTLVWVGLAALVTRWDPLNILGKEKDGAKKFFND